MNFNQFLCEHHVRFRTVRHDPTPSAQRMAHSLHVPGDNVAKTVVLKADDKYVLAVVPATHCVDLSLARKALTAHSLKLAREDEFAAFFDDCEPGAVPPFGSCYGVGTLVDEALTHDEFIVFEAGSHAEAICVRYSDFEAIEDPLVSVFSRHL